MIIQPQQKLI